MENFGKTHGGVTSLRVFWRIGLKNSEKLQSGQSNAAQGGGFGRGVLQRGSKLATSHLCLFHTSNGKRYDLSSAGMSSNGFLIDLVATISKHVGPQADRFCPQISEKDPPQAGPKM